MSDYISREQAVKQITKVAEQIKTNNSPYILTALYLNNKEDFPSADVRENIHGEWIREDIHSSWKCSRCNTYAIEDFEHCEIRSPFCPNCGADMRGESK